jgi:uncharacterized membrane protein
MTKYESETTIVFNDEEQHAAIYTCNAAWKRKLAKLAKDNADMRKIREDSESVAYHVPKKWVKLRTPRILSEEQKEKLRERGKQITSTLPISSQ